MDLVRLREILRPRIVGLKHTNRGVDLPSVCQKLGLEAPAEEGSKADRLGASFEALPDAKLPSTAESLLEFYPPDPETRNRIQDLLWIDSSIPEIPKKCRHEIARALENQPLYRDVQRFDELLGRLWIIDSDPLLTAIFGGSDNSLHAEIKQHLYRNPGDWSVEMFFSKLGAFDASDHRFALFLEGMASPDVRADEESQRQFVNAVNGVLRNYGAEFRETSSEGGYPVFAVVSTRAASMRRPKNLIFASSVKPDIRFRDAVNNDIEIVSNADKVLVYDRVLGGTGIRWRDLQSWWSETAGVEDDDEAKRSLYRRLKDCLPKESPPQILFFDTFHRSFGSAIPDLPALLPEVWLHWDPKTVRERGADALLRFRMDFLMLLPHGVRIVIEVDGKSHYANDAGQADPVRYAAMLAGDRDLRLAGYELYRFGAAELMPGVATATIEKFFNALFKRHGIPSSNAG